MRKTVKVQMLQILATMKEAHKELGKYIQEKQYGNVTNILADCQECAILVGETIDRFETDQEQIVKQLEEYCEKLFLINAELETMSGEDGKNVREELDQRINRIYQEVRDNIKVVLKVAFLPYKASMWASLASVWKAAQEDPDCEVQVVVIPYYKLNRQQQPTELVYEASLFPAEVPITHYSQYDVAAEQPDMIFIHNPYDDTNNVTRVPEQYYSYNLKKHTEKLIYSPYGMMGYYNPNEGAFMCCTNAVMVADKVLVQSERVKQIYIDHGVSRSKLLALGSPKVDAVVEGLKQPPIYPEGWEERLKGRKVFLLNTHLSYFIRGYVYALENPGKSDYAKWFHEQIFEQLLNREGCALIWRPHPLMKTTLESRNLYDSLKFVEELERKIEESDNAVLDMHGEYDISFRVSDALVTTYSSMIPEYMISGKPIYIYQHRLNEDNCRKSPVNYSNNYYRARPGEGRQFPKFIDMVLNGEDFLYEQRMADVHRAFSNLDGTIGKNVYQKLKDEWQVL